MIETRTWLLRAVAVAIAALAAALPARAHPHVWVTVEATLLYANGAFTGVRHKWTFDENYTTAATEGLDKNNDGTFDRAELAELAKVNVEALKDFEYFTFPTLEGQAMKVATPLDDYWLEHKDGLLSLHFTVPFASPVLTDAKGLAFSIYDPSFFIAFDLAKTEPVRLGSGAPKGCALTINNPPEQRETAALGPMSQLGGVVSIGRTVSVACTSAPAPARK